MSALPDRDGLRAFEGHTEGAGLRTAERRDHPPVEVEVR
jgi:hypothetical protein